MDRKAEIILTSGGAAYNLELGFVPHYVECKNLTKWATVSQNIWTWWYYGMGDGYYAGYANQSNLTDGLKAITGTSNGFTAYDTSTFTSKVKLIDTGSSKVTKASAAVVTSTSHGLSTGDVVTFNGIQAGMVELNGLRSTITYIGANSFSCDDIDSTGFTTWDASEAYGQFTVTSDITDNTGKKGVTLGTIPMANSSDVLCVTAFWFEKFGSVSA